MAAGSAVLLVLLLLAARLFPAYLLNLEFQRALDETVQQAAGSATLDDVLRAEVVNRAARLGLPVRLTDIRVKRAERRLEIEVLYVVPVELPLYTVDLHFRPRASVP
jgi:hypothetical protein